MAGWHHRLDGHGSGWTPGVGDGQGGLECCNSWGRKESDTTELLNWTELKIMLKILQAKFQQYVNWEVPDVQSGLRKGRGTRDQIAYIHWTTEKARKFKKNNHFFFTNYFKALTLWITTNCGKFLKKWEYHTTLSASWETCKQAKKQQLESYMDHQQPQVCGWYHTNGRKWRGTKEPLDDGERGEWESWLITQYSKN